LAGDVHIDLLAIETFQLQVQKTRFQLIFRLLFLVASCSSVAPSFGQCQSAFEVNNSFCEFDTVNFTFTGSASQVSWIFGDSLSGLANTSSKRNTTHVFTSSGRFIVRCIAKDSMCSDTSTLLVHLVSKPTLDIQSTNSCISLSTDLKSVVTLDSFDQINSISWRIDSTVVSTDSSVSKKFTNQGPKDILLSVTTQKGCKDSINKKIVIKDSVAVYSSQDTVCEKDILKFTADTRRYTPTTWDWNFGDKSFSNNKSPKHSFSQLGSNAISLTLTYSDGQTCQFTGGNIFVRPLPKSLFRILSDTQQCFADNEVCVAFAANSSPIKYRRIIWDDGNVSEPDTSSSSYCHTFKDSLGGIFLITQELVDIYGCASSFKTDKQVIIRQALKADFDLFISGGCLTTLIEATNWSNVELSAVKEFTWDFGNGDFNSIDWDTVRQTYIRDGIYTASLSIQDTFGCVDTFSSAELIENVSFTMDADIDTVLNHCHNNNEYIFGQSTIPEATILWNMGDGTIKDSFRINHTYPQFGKYLPSVIVSKKGCRDTIILDTVIVYGPKADFDIINRYQCMINDTVKFRNTSSVFENDHLLVFWEVDDPYGIQCEVDTKNGQNLNKNCNLSRDSQTFQHWFTPGKEQCYYANLLLIDTLTGCSDSIEKAIPLMPPSADSGLRVLYDGSVPCGGPEVNKTIRIDLSQTSPGCDQERWYVMWDSVCAEKSGKFDDYWIAQSTEHNYYYGDSPCDSSGQITIGLILQNGQDSSGNTCRDTAFYHHIFTLPLQNPIFNTSYNPDSTYCRNSSFDFYFTDTTQDTAQQVIWDFGDGSVDTTNNFKPVSHMYKTSGNYRVTAKLFHDNGCLATYQEILSIGINKNHLVQDSMVCLGDSVKIKNISTYWNGKSFGSSNYHGTSSWDVGDSSVHFLTSSEISITYSQTGNYDIQIFLSDSLGCKDTIKVSKPVRVFGVFADFVKLPDTLVCSQVIQLENKSSVFDSVTRFQHEDDTVKSVFWTFGNGVGSSVLDNPTKYFNFGMNVIELVAENATGCRDTIKDSTYFTKPKAKFTINSSPKGCQPHLVQLNNRSSNATNFKWYFRDRKNSVRVTEVDSVIFTYENYGVFEPELVAEYSFLKNGVKYSCLDTFPNEFSVLQPKITVYEKPRTNFLFRTNCSSKTTQFTNTTQLRTDSLKSLTWRFGDGSSSIERNPSHQYQDTGVYQVTLETISSNGCRNEITKTVIISPPPHANFTKDNICEGELAIMNDSTEAFNDQIYRWNWDLGDGNRSTSNSVSHLYATDSLYTVTLIVWNRAGCSDTISKMLDVYDTPTAAFISDSICIYDTLTLASQSYTSADTLYTFWDFGDNSGASHLTTAKHRYTNPREYRVQLVVTNNYGCMDSVTLPTKIYPIPNASFSVENDSQCVSDNKFNFKNSSTISEGKFQSIWKTSTTQFDTSQDFYFTFSKVGSYKTTLKTISSYGCIDSFSAVVRTLESPNVKIISSDTDVCIIDGLVTFEDSTISQHGSKIQSRFWTVSDTLQFTGHRFECGFRKPGENKVKLIVTYNNGCSDSSQAIINSRPKPKAKFTLKSIDRCLPKNRFEFTSRSSIDDSSRLTHFWDLGNQDSSTSSNLIYSYEKADTFLVKMVSTSIYQCRDTAEQSLVVFASPIAQFSLDSSSNCLRENYFKLKNESSITNGSLSFFWDLHGEDTSTSIQPLHSFNSVGKKTIQLIARANNGCRDTTQTIVEVHPHPRARIKVNDTAQCLNDQEFVFEDQSELIGETLSRLWIWSDGERDTALKIAREFDSVGQHVHHLVAISTQNCRDTAAIELSVLALPSLEYKINSAEQCLDSNLFELESLTNSNEISKYKWDFGDSDTQNTIAPKHTYSKSGDYNILLSLTTNQTCTDSIIIPVKVFFEPKSIFEVNDTIQCFNGHLFELSGKSEIKNDTIEHYKWLIDGSRFSENKDTIIRFDDVDTFKVIYEVTSTKGCNDISRQNLIVTPNPESKISINDTIQCRRNNDFVVQSLSTIESGTMHHIWFHDDSKISDSIGYTFSGNDTDTILVKLVDVSNEGCNDTSYAKMYIVPHPRSDFKIQDTIQCLKDNKVSYLNKSTSNLGSLQHKWSFGDNSSDTTINPVHSYQNHGKFTTQLVTTSSLGCSDTGSKSVLINPMPFADFSVNDSSQCQLGNLFQFSNQSFIDSTDVSFFWHWGDKQTSDTREPMHSYDSYGKYSIKLLVTSEFGCLDSISKSVDVHPIPEPLITVNDSDQCVNEQNFKFINESSIVEGQIPEVVWRIESKIYRDLDSINHYFSQSGTYTVLLQVTSSEACTDSVEQQVLVYVKPKGEITVNDSVQCLQDNLVTYNYSLQNTVALSNHQWFYRDTVVGENDSYRRSFLSPGLKNIVLVVQTEDACSDTVISTVRIKPMPDPSFEKLRDYYCLDSVGYSLNPITPGGIFKGKNIMNQTYLPSILWEDEVIYRVSIEGCEDSSIQKTEVYPPPVVKFPQDTMLCKFESFELNAAGFRSSYLWQDRSTKPNYLVRAPGVYYVRVTNMCGTSQDTISVTYKDNNCRIYLPTAFSPNQDNLNELYTPVTFKVDQMRYSIYNRWGEKLFEGNPDTAGWNGTYRGDNCQSGWYLVMVEAAFETLTGRQRVYLSEVFYLLR